MNREIKFRAWNTDENKWWYLTLGDVLNLHSLNLALKQNPSNFDSSSWQQYTGLKDKNGVEIYHSDFVMHSRHLYEVVWVQSMSCWKLRNRDKAIDADDDFLSKSYTLEVIGNMYENPELLND